MRTSHKHGSIAQQEVLGQLLNSKAIVNALSELGIEYRERVFSPLWTLWAWLSQVLSSDQSCRMAVAAVNISRERLEKLSCSMNTGAYARARQRLSEEFLSRIQRATAEELEAAQLPDWLWHKRNVKLVDGTVISMPETLSNQQAYGWSTGVFPSARVVGVFSFSCGTCLDVRVSPMCGEGHGEPSLLLQMWDNFKPQDIALFDRNFSNYPIFAKCILHDVDFVSRLNPLVKLEKYRKERLGPNEWLVELKADGLKWVKKDFTEKIPPTIQVRIIKAKVKTPGFRVKTISVITSLLDAKAYPASEVVELYRQRWDVELDLRCIKTELKMDVLRVQTPEMVRKDVRMHIICYNLLRMVMAQAAARHGHLPREMSFKLTQQVFETFRIALTGDESDAYWTHIYQSVLNLIGNQPLPARPGRIEPRAVRRIKRKYRRLRQSRDLARRQFWKTNGSNKRPANSVP